MSIQHHIVDENKHYPWESHYPDGVDWRASIDIRPLYHLLDNAVLHYPKSPAIDFLGKIYNYDEIGKLSNEVAYSLQKMGIAKDSKVGLLLPNTPYYLIFYYAILKIGGTVVNYNPLYAERELEHQIADSDTDFMVTMDLKLMQNKISKIIDNTRLKKIIVCPMANILPFPKNILFPILKFNQIASISKTDDRYIWFKDMIGHGKQPEPVEIDPHNDIAVLQYTGGTTGVPKGAMLTHENLYANTMQTALWIKTSVNTGQNSQMMGVLPFFHVFAMTVVMNMSVWYGMKILAVPKFDVEDVMKIIDREKPTYFPAVPAIYNAIANHDKIDNYDFSSIVFCLSGGAPLPEDVKRLFEEKVKNKCLGEGYGLTESSPVVSCNPLSRIKQGSIGVPFPNTVIDIVDRDDKKSLMPIGEKGEICISGPQVMKGYYKREDATNETIINGRLHTGDIGYMDDEGYIFIVDRIKDLILVRGYNVYPRQIEEAIYLHSSVEECVVAGVPDKKRGETVWAWIKPIDGMSVNQEELEEFLKDKLSPIEIPRKIIIRNEPLPKTDIGKLSRKKLLEQENLDKS